MHISFVLFSPGSVETDVGEVGTWRAIWWPAMSGLFVQKIVKIRQSFLKLQSIMSGYLVLRHSVF